MAVMIVDLTFKSFSFQIGGWPSYFFVANTSMEKDYWCYDMMFFLSLEVYLLSVVLRSFIFSLIIWEAEENGYLRSIDFTFGSTDVT